MRVLVVEDEKRLAGRGRPRGGGVHRRRRHDGDRRAVDWPGSTPTTSSCSTSCCPGLQRLPGLCAACGQAEHLDADPHAHRQGRRVDEAEALDTGADDYLTKPFSYVVLVARLRALLRRGARPRPRCSRSATSASTRRAAGRGAARSRSRLTARESDAARVPDAPRRARWSRKARDPRQRVGRRLRGRPEHRRGLRRATCATRSTAPFGRAAIETRARRRLPAGGRRRLTPPLRRCGVRIGGRLGASSSSGSRSWRGRARCVDAVDAA